LGSAVFKELPILVGASKEYVSSTNVSTAFDLTALSHKPVLAGWQQVGIVYPTAIHVEAWHGSIKLLKKAKTVSVREAQAGLSKLIRSKSPSMVLSHGKPVSFLVPYEDMLDLVDTLEELKDQRLLGEIARSRAEYAQGKAVPR
jgi:antitoxin (DNA-binding transcriptional repressor) of toxin-antitoxin stability system